MTESEFRKQLNDRYQFTAHPEVIKVDVDTYAHLCQAVLQHCVKYRRSIIQSPKFVVCEISLDPSGNFFYKGSTIILDTDSV